MAQSELKNCSLCASSDFDTNDYVTCKNNHLLCEECMLSIVNICTCDLSDCANFPLKPNLIYMCHCEETVCREVEIKEIIPYLKCHHDNIYYIEGCKGCKFNIEDKKNDFFKASISAIDYCHFLKGHNNVEFIGYELDYAFVKACEKSKISLHQDNNI